MDRARKIFFDTNGNKHWIWHDGLAEEYESYHVSKEQEDIWYEELLQKHLHELESDGDPNLIFPLIESISNSINDNTYIEKGIVIIKNRSSNN